MKNKGLETSKNGRNLQQPDKTYFKGDLNPQVKATYHHESK